MDREKQKQLCEYLVARCRRQGVKLPQDDAKARVAYSLLIVVVARK